MKHIGYGIVNTYGELVNSYPLGCLRMARTTCGHMNAGISQKPYSLIKLFREEKELRA